MSVFQSLIVGTTGVKTQSTAFGTISDNVANINTVGYKKSSTLFRNLVSNDFATAFSPGGSATATRSINRGQGIIINTSSVSDLAIGGGGYFAVRANSASDGDIFYTRAGAFGTDENGDYKNTAGFYLQGWLLENEALPDGLNASSVDGATGIAALVPVNVLGQILTASPTTNVSLTGNLKSSEIQIVNGTVTVNANLNAAQALHTTGRVSLDTNLSPSASIFSSGYDPTISAQNMSSGNVTPSFNQTISVIDNTGASRDIEIGFLKTATNTWAVEIYAVPASDVTQTDGQLAYGNIVFNSNGTPLSISPSLTTAVNAGWNNVGGASSISFNFGALGTLSGLSQTGTHFSATATVGPDYDPTVSGVSMASGAVTPDFTQTVQIPDENGTVRTLVVGFLKTSDNTWAVEIYGQPLSDVTSSPVQVAGQVAYGTATFNTNGSLASISSSLMGRLPVGWNLPVWNAAGYDNFVTFDWGILGTAPSVTATGLFQQTSAYADTSTVTIYDPSVITENMADGGFTPTFTRAISVIDSAGEEHSITVGFLKTSTLQWAVELYASSAAELGSTSAQIASGSLVFNNDGSLGSISPSLSSAIGISWALPAAATNSFTIDWGTLDDTDGFVQFDAAYRATANQDGYMAGSISSVNFTDDGFVVANFNNGVSRRLYKIPLGDFSEPNQLKSENGNVFSETLESGDVYFTQPGLSGRGKIYSGSLENSNVDLSSELTEMIIAQRSYQANSKVISTTDQMLQKLDEMLA